MRRRLLSGTAIGLTLALTVGGPLGGGRALANCLPDPPDDGDNDIVCIDPVPGPVYSLLDGDDTVTFDGAVIGDGGAQTVLGATGNDTLVGLSGSELGDAGGSGTLLGNSGADALIWIDSDLGLNGSALVDMGSGADSVTLSGQVLSTDLTLLGGLGDDAVTLDGSSGTMVFGFIAGTASTLAGGSGADSFSVSSASFGNFANAGTSLTGNSGSDSFFFHDLRIGNLGHATVDGGLGDDTIVFEDDVALGVLTGGEGVVLGGSGADSFHISDTNPDALFNIIGDQGDGTLDMGSGDDVLTASGDQQLSIGHGASGSGTLLGGAGNDTITGSLLVGLNGHGTLSGGSGNDVVTSAFLTVASNGVGGVFSEGVVDLGSGNDLLQATTTNHIAFEGRATILGGDGDDTMVFATSTLIATQTGAEASIYGGSGEDLLAMSGTAIVGFSDGGASLIDLGDGGDRFLLESTSVAPSMLNSSDSATTLLGGQGDDTLTFRGSLVAAENGGQTTVDGGAGADLFMMSSLPGFDARIDATGAAVALVDLGADDDRAAIDAAFVGAAGTGTLTGGGGMDTLELSNGAAIGLLTGASGFVHGGADGDRIVLTDARVGAAGSGLIGGDGGDDTIEATGSTFAESVGSSATLLGGAGGDTLDFAGGVVGLAGVVQMDGGDDDDLFRFVGTSLASQATAAVSVGGGSGADSFLFDGAQIGGDGTLALDGGSGSDSIDLASGSDVGDGATLSGGLGSDLVSLEDSVTLAAGALLDGGDGDDTLELDGMASGTLPSLAQLVGFENLVKAESGTWIWNQAAVFSGTARIDGGILRLAGVTLTATSGSTIAAAGTLEGNGTLGGNLVNQGNIAPGDSTLVDDTRTLTIDGDYQGDAGATLSLDVTLGTAGGDLLRITGATSGTTEILVDLVGPVVTNDPTLVVEVGTAGGTTAAGDFTMLSFMADGFVYGLSLEGDDNWYIVQTGAVPTLCGEPLPPGPGTPGDDVIVCEPVIDDGTTVNAQAGNDEIFLNPDVGTPGEDLVIGIDASSSVVGGSGDDRVIFGGSGGDEVILGLNDGSGGTVFGGTGNDRFDGRDLVVGQRGEGVILGELGDDLFVLRDIVVGAEATGSGTLTGDSGADGFSFAGSDFGVAGQATVSGGSGDDMLVFGSGSDLGLLSGGTAWAAGDDGDDTLALTSGSELGGAGSASFTGGSGADLLLADSAFLGGSTGGGGTFAGGSGADLLIAHATVIGVTGAGALLGGDGDDTLELAQGSTLGGNGLIDGGSGSDLLRLEGGTARLAGGLLDGGAGDDTLELFGGLGVVDSFGAGEGLANVENLAKSGAGAWHWEQSLAFSGSGDFQEGVFRIAAGVDLGFAGGATVAALATLEGRGTLSASLVNFGLVAPGNDSSDPTQTGTLTIAGDYDGGAGAMLRLDVTLGGGGGDILAIGGDSSGATTVAINLLGDNGSGLDTLVIDMTGLTAEEHFTLAGPVVSQGFEWDLVLNDEGDWVLRRGELAPMMPGERANALIGSSVLNVWHSGAGPLHERLGELRALQRAGGPQTAALGGGDAAGDGAAGGSSPQLAVRAGALPSPSGLWVRAVGEAFDHDASIGTAFRQETTILQAGWDLGLRGALLDGDLVTIGAFAGVVGSRAEATGLDVSLEGYSVGAYGSLLWEGLHLDLLGKADFLQVEREESDPAFTAAYDAWSIGGAAEAGWRFELGEGYFLEPSGQLAYVAAFIDDSPTAGGGTLLAEDSHSLRGRLALRAGGSFALGDGRLLPYAEIGVVHEFLGESEARVGLDSATSDLSGTAVELGLGLAALDVADNLQLTLDADFVTGGTGSGVQVTGGLRFSW